MGRELKRVPLDFQWPLEKVWKGFINPYPGKTQCEACGGKGSSPGYRRLEDMWYGYASFKPEDRGSKPFAADDEVIVRMARRACERSPWYYGDGEDAVEREAVRLANLFNSRWCHHLNAGDIEALLKRDRLWDFTRTWNEKDGWQPKDPPYIPSPSEVNLWSLTGMGHDGINCWVCVEAECHRLGIDPDCPECRGEGGFWPSPEAEALHESWKPEEPPVGEGYQIWETVSEGSPMSPVFSDPEDLAEWMAQHPRGVDVGTTKGQWLNFILGPGWAPSLIQDASGVRSGVQS